VDASRLKRILLGDFTLKRLVRSMFTIAVLVYLGLFLFAYFYADKIIFQPPPSSYRDSNQIIKLVTGNGEKISAIYLPNNAGVRYTILYSHGNAEDIGQLVPMLEEIRDMGFAVFAYDYRGYGTSSGTPSEEHVYLDADAAYNYLINDLHIPAARIIAMGRSLGGAVAIDLAHKRQLGGLIVESSFVTAFRLMTRVPLFPFDKFTNLSKLKQVHCPVLVVHGKDDEVVPFWHGERLFQQANEPKRSYWVDGAGHNNLFEVAGTRYGQVLRDFAAMVEQSDNFKSHK
jgi:fermentation-respiration switch protein FrsA (DUF1100 family)